MSVSVSGVSARFNAVAQPSVDSEQRTPLTAWGRHPGRDGVVHHHPRCQHSTIAHIRLHCIRSCVSGSLCQIVAVHIFNSKYLLVSRPAYTFCPQRITHITTLSSTDDEIAARPYVVLTARVHPGETPASFIIKVRAIRSLLCS